jgi:putative endonuclease
VRYVYILKSIGDPDKRYFGITSDLVKRLKHHNNGCSRHTRRYRPWRLDTYVGFSDEKRAEEFERYLKTGSGKAFSQKRM